MTKRQVCFTFSLKGGEGHRCQNREEGHALYVLALWASEAPGLGTTARLVLVLLPVPAFAIFLVEWIRNIRRLDELERRVQLEALAVAYPIALVLIMALGLIERVTPLNPDDYSYRHLWPPLVGIYFMGLAIARRRYR